jgi:hypothetical protein
MAWPGKWPGWPAVPGPDGIVGTADAPAKASWGRWTDLACTQLRPGIAGVGEGRVAGRCDVGLAEVASAERPGVGADVAGPQAPATTVRAARAVAIAHRLKVRDRGTPKVSGKPDPFGNRHAPWATATAPLENGRRRSSR